MPTYTPPLEDIRFVLHDVLNVGQLAEFEGYEEATPDLIDAILEEAGKMAAEVLQPLNASGDAEGLVLENGVVRTPRGFKQAYDLFAAGGWCGLIQPSEYGGQGMPRMLSMVMSEMISSANMAFGMFPGLSEGAMHALELHASDALKQLYLPPMIEGRWTGTMNLTEPQCGTDLGLIRTRAEPREDGSYAITGTKIYISAGEHDLSENIIHLVLARLPDAPAGVKGISLFVVPKFLPVEDGEGGWQPGPRNAVQCLSIEEKMGIHASPTCVMDYADAKGWLVGQPNKGLRAMFTMMNAARLGVGMQGLGLVQVAYENALAFARDRRQGRALSGAREPDQPADPITVHPDVRRMLMTMRCVAEAGRLLAYETGLKQDIAAKHPDPAVREAAGDWVDLMTPIIKAYLTDMGFESASLAVQVHGGHGFVRDYGVEQFVRDARIAMLYEGTNGIQALDLVGRKMTAHMGRALRRFFHPVQQELDAAVADPALQEIAFPVYKAFGKLQQATGLIAEKGLKNPDEAGAASTDYLRMFALVALGVMWLRMLTRLEGKDESFAAEKRALARFFVTRMLPEAEARFRMITAGAAPLMDEAVGF